MEAVKTEFTKTKGRVGELEEKVMALMRNENRVQILEQNLEKVKFDMENLLEARSNEIWARMSIIDDSAHEAASSSSATKHKLNQFDNLVQGADARIRTVQSELLDLQQDS